MTDTKYKIYKHVSYIQRNVAYLVLTFAYLPSVEDDWDISMIFGASISISSILS